MTLITSIKDYIKRHRQGLLITATIAGGGYLAGKYASNKLRDIQEKSTAERLAKENLKRRFQQNQNDCVFTVLSLLPTLGDQILTEMNIEKDWAKLQESRKLEKIELKLKQEREHAAIFKEEQETMNQLKETTVDSVVLIENNQTQEESEQKNNNNQTMLDSSVGSLTSSISEVDQRPAGILSKKEKHILWEDIKSKSFIRTLTSIYSVTLLTLLTHIQLNLLGRFTYIWSVSILNKSEPTIRLQQEGEEPDVGFLDPQIERMFLSVSWWLLHRGWKSCAKRVEEAVNEIVSSIPLKSTLNYQEAEELLSKLRTRIEYEQDNKPISYQSWMLPNTEEEELEYIRSVGFDEVYAKENTSTISLKKLLNETRDFIDSPDFYQVLNSCLNEVFAIFNHHTFVTSLLPQNNSLMLGSSIRELSPAEVLQLEKQESKKMTLANLLPIIGRQSHLVIAGNEYLNAFAYIKELQAFSALIYTYYGDEVKIA
ncbi:Peroxin-3 [Cokeromyces recurvatus]|uniref:Peroxin-3 n=1 Tax=Cokeromyces recurvatus TaxID=90255 RepID=UPI002220D027|nr:Peroxin-3 [Cokeromyces recurvatus]KAI7905032.1 Peroxin-3 [Cokeromyces recurvatus]